jgi:hypothetical protein
MSPRKGKVLSVGKATPVPQAAGDDDDDEPEIVESSTHNWTVLGFISKHVNEVNITCLGSFVRLALS